MTATAPGAIPALLPCGPGHQFVLYADACSGVAGAPHEGNLAAVNAVLRRLAPAPEFILFPGDEIVGLVADAGALRRGSKMGYTWSRVDASRTDDGTLTFSGVVRDGSMCWFSSEAARE